MKIQSFTTDLVFDTERIQTKVILETSFSKEIRIALSKGQLMKEHKAPFPIVIHVLQGSINLGSEGEIQEMNAGDLITLDANVPHDLRANENSIIRLTLSKLDTIARVESLI
ncbi:cupin domain-containing protein [Flavobacterium sp. I3-2]|uniref:cupin domain-containing protein n=1 Tax=Flavobacterium sp. I3-2 TaxID=2748319 RepID=UPI0015B0AF8B|nr:cupin domain-containing protein [Flavobacterium sp. I3-2]